jgi:hypothetical protein
MKTAKEVFDEKYEYYRNMENKPPIPPEARELIFQAMEQYHESRMKEELIAFLSSMNQGIAYGLNEWAIKNYVDDYLATRKNK